MRSCLIIIAAVLVSSLSVSCVENSQGEEGTIEFRRAIGAPGMADANENPFRKLARDPVLEACQPCEVFEWETPSGGKRTLHVALQTEAALKPNEIRQVIVRENLPFGGETTFFTVEVEPTVEAAHVGRSLAGLGALHPMVIRVGGAVVGVEDTSTQWAERIRIGTFRTEEEAVQVAERLGREPIVEPLSEAELQAEQERFLAFASDFFWENACAAGSPIAREQEPLWIETKAVLPHLVDRIDCSQPPHRHQIVPPDQSLTISQYQALGVPEIDHTWSDQEHAEAITALGKLDRTALPRYGSPRSGVLFNHLVEDQGAETNSTWGNTRVGQDTLELPQSALTVAGLYEPSSEDRLLFDRELLEIYSEALRRRIEALKATIVENAELRTRLAEERDEGARHRIQKLLESDKASINEHEMLVGLALLNLLELSAVEAVGEGTRLSLRDRLTRWVPLAEPHLSPAKVNVTAEALREFATLDPNARIQFDLVALAESLNAPGSSAPKAD